MIAPAEEGRAGQRFLGGCLLAVGLLIATLCGACTLLFAGAFLIGAGGSHGAQIGMVLWTLAIPLIIGGIPTAIGVALAVVGWRLLRPAKPSPPPENIFS